MSTVDDKTLRETVEAFKHTGGNQNATASNLHIARSTLQNRLRVASARGLVPGVAEGGVPEGSSLAGTSTLFRVDGGDGASPVLQWVKAKREPDYRDVAEIVAEAMEGITSPALLSDPLPYTNDALLTMYPIADLHLGMYAWKEETGESYDLDIASKTMRGTMEELVANAPSSSTALILNLGDFFHSDSDENRTRRSGNALDTDTRYAKVLRTGVELEVAAIHLALQRHAHVFVRNLQGNHDPYAALALTLAIDAYFKKEPRVFVDTTPSPFFFHRHGRVLLGATHGDMAKPTDMVGIMAAKRAEDWGQSDFRYIFLGHFHSHRKGQQIGEVGGAQWEVLQTIAPRDAWGNSMGFTAGRSAIAVTYHKERGEMVRQTVNVRQEKP